MSNYTKTTNFASKDNLSPGNPLKIVKGTEIDTEFNNIQTAVGTKTDNSAANITGGTIVGITDLAVADGGTGASTAAGALNNLLPSQTSAANKYLQSDGTNASWDAVSLSTSDITGTLAVANGGTGVTSSTGTGNVVLSNSPTLVTPALGTPASGTATNLTGLPISTGVSGLGTGVATFLGTPSSANLLAAVSDETGTGALVFATSPTLVTPALGTPSALVGTNITGTASGLTAGNVTTNANLTGAVTSVGNATSLGSFSSANLLAALTDETGTGSAVFATSPTLVTPILGTPTSVTLTNATGLPLSTGVTGQLPVANGGTGTATPSIVAGTNVTVTGTWPNQTIAASSGGTPGGSTTQVQYNNAGAFGGITGATTNGTALTLVAPVLGTPASATLTNATGLPISTGVSGLGTGVATALAVNVGSSGAPLVNGGVLGTPSSGTVTNLTGTASININGTVGATTPAAGAFTSVTASTTLGVTGVSTFSAGTAALPALTTTGDTNTGIFFPAADTIAFTEGGTESMRLNSSGQFGIGTTSPGNKLTVADNSASAMIYAEQSGAGDIIALASGSTERFRITNAGNVGIGTSSPTSKLQSQTSSSGSTPNMLSLVNNTGGAANATGVKLWMSGRAAQADADRGTYIEAVTTDTNNAHAMVFATSGSGLAPTERARIDSSGNLLVGTTSQIGSTASRQVIKFDNNNFYGLALGGSASGAAGMLNFYNSAGTEQGYISTTGSGSTSYVTSSDYRLKENIAPMTGALAKVAQLKPVTYTWKQDGSSGQGFIAHELQAIVPDCVTREKDAVDADGNPKYQGVDTSFLVATLTAAIQEQQAMIESLKARLDAANL